MISIADGYFDTRGGTRQMSLEHQSFCNAESGLKLTFANNAVTTAMAVGGVVMLPPYGENQASDR